MKYLYKYPQAAFPYADLVETSRRRGRHEFEYELLDTGVFDEDRYFDVFVEYAKESPEDILIQITRPQPRPGAGRAARPADALVPQPVVLARRRRPADAAAGRRHPGAERRPGRRRRARRALPLLRRRRAALFTENETNTQRIFGVPNRSPYVKDGINNYVVHGQDGAVNPEKKGTKAAAHYRLTVGPGECQVDPAAPQRRRAGRPRPRATASRGSPFGSHFDEVLPGAARRRPTSSTPPSPRPRSDADAGQRHAPGPGGDAVEQAVLPLRRGQVARGARLRPVQGRRARPAPRNDHWHHMYNGDVISMPDKWEYPWYAAWDLAFHVLALTLVDPDFGKQQLKLMLRERYMHPNGQIPAYEWNFGDVNPPVHAWSTIFTYRLEKAQTGEGDRDWLKSCFQKLLLNFTWWVNRKDRSGRNVFEGGFLGLDNIGVFDRSAPLPTGGYLEQADGTAWMALFCQNMLEIAVELAMTDPDYADMALKFVEHFLWIASSMAHLGGDTGMWDEEDGFFYDVLRLPDGQAAAAQGPVDGRPAAAVRRHGLRRASCWRSTRSSASGSRWFLDARPELLRRDPRPAQGRRRRPPARLHPGRDQAPPRAGEDARRERVPQRLTASARCRASTPTTPTSSTPAARSTASPTCRPSPTPACSAATRTGAARSGCRSTP